MCIANAQLHGFICTCDFSNSQTLTSLSENCDVERQGPFSHDASQIYLGKNVQVYL